MKQLLNLGTARGEGRYIAPPVAWLGSLLLLLAMFVPGLTANAATLKPGDKFYVKFTGWWADANAVPKIDFYKTGTGSTGYQTMTAVSGQTNMWEITIPKKDNITEYDGINVQRWSNGYGENYNNSLTGQTINGNCITIEGVSGSGDSKASWSNVGNEGGDVKIMWWTTNAGVGNNMTANMTKTDSHYVYRFYPSANGEIYFRFDSNGTKVGASENDKEVGSSANGYDTHQVCVETEYNSWKLNVTAGTCYEVEFWNDNSYKIDDNAKQYVVRVVNIPITGFYLTGNLNEWVSVSNGANPNADKAADWIFTRDTEKTNKYGEDGWYVYTMPEGKEFYGQFQILRNGDFGGVRYAHSIGKEADVVKESATDKEYYFGKPVNDLVGDEMSTDGDETLAEATGSLANCHLKHNYYQNARIYFNPQTKKVYIQGTPRDMYIYYFAPADQTGDKNVNNANALENKVNYLVDDTKMEGKMDRVPVSSLVDDKTDSNLNDVFDYYGSSENKENLVIYRYTVAPGLEQMYATHTTDEYNNKVYNQHYFNFSLTGASKVNASHKYIYDGQNVYFINYNLPTVLVQPQLKKLDGSLVNLVGHETHKLTDVKVRFMTVDATGKPLYVADNGTTVESRDGARVLNMSVTVEDGELEGKWLGIKAEPEAGTETADLAPRKAPGWKDQIGTVQVANRNRFIEVELTLAMVNKNTNGTYYFSDFDYNDNKTPKSLTDARDYKLKSADLFVQPEIVQQGSTGVEEVGDSNDGAPVEYYSLQGVRVENPSNGIYIRVQGANRTKVMVK